MQAVNVNTNSAFSSTMKGCEIFFDTLRLCVKTNYKQIKLDSDSRSRSEALKDFFDGAKYYKKLKMSELNYESVSKMKVAELRSALEDHGLDSKGTKPILVARLQSYMENQPSQNAEPGNK